MSSSSIDRRSALKTLGLTACAALMPYRGLPAARPAAKPSFTLCLNLVTIRGQQLGFVRELEVAAKAGFRSVEIWMDTLQEYLKHGGTLKEARSRLDSLGLTVENCLTLPEWIVDDPIVRKKALEQLKQEMAMMAELGCRRTIATGKGLTPDTTITLDTIALRYRQVLELGVSMDVIPMLELWGFQKQLSTVSDVIYSIMQSGHPAAKILLDIFHLYKGRTPLDTLPFINPAVNDILHMNDYPAGLSPEVITDADRIYPGDGVAPTKRIIQALQRHDQPLILSVELFNESYYRQDPLSVARTALRKLKTVVAELD